MRSIVISTFSAFLLLAGLSGAADAKGCLKGAAVGGLAGHMAGHGVLGAAGGCAVGHHEAAKHDKERAQQAQTNGNASNSSH